MARLYTKTGDKGETSLRDGKRCSKADRRVEAIGAVDELNSVIAVAIVEAQSSKLKAQNKLVKVQSDLFHVGALLTGEKNNRKKRIEHLDDRVNELEKEIDKIQKGLPAQKGFVLPGGAKPSACLDFARAVCRRAERRVAGLGKVPAVLVKYLNRLSDYLYSLARLANFKLGKDETKWKNNFYSST